MENNETLDSTVIQQQDQYVKDNHLASTGKRFANFLIDMVVVNIFAFIVGVVYIIYTGNEDMDRLTSYLISYILILIYYTMFESLTGKTLGKLITGTTVVCDDFSKPSFGKIVQRSFCRIIPFEPFSCLGSKPTGWHDTIPSLWVIEDKWKR